MRAIAFAALAALLACGCSVKFDEEQTAPYACTNSADCRGDGYLCVALETGPAFCCKPSPEVCDGVDNDCNGKVDDLGVRACYSGPDGTGGVGLCQKGTQTCENAKWTECFDERTPGLESCNGYDDDCDGLTDEDFDFNGDAQHCGNCETRCVIELGQWCANGKCSKDTESCNDAIDNDRDGQTDCADSDCLGQPCQASPSSYTCDAQLACSCKGNPSPGPETVCNDHGDDDCDGAIDCLDSDCDAQSCGVGCTCKNLQMTEASCSDYADNDGDTLIDCADPDCDGASCGTGCLCSGNKNTETDCADGISNDGDAQRDCVDDDCVGKPCNKGGDAGLGTCVNHACQ